MLVSRALPILLHLLLVAILSRRLFIDLLALASFVSLLLVYKVTLDLLHFYLGYYLLDIL